jgi:dTDP-L-rhamnose 4-epimerase
MDGLIKEENGNYLNENNMRILITGGAGFIGTHLSRKLIKEGNFVRVLDNFDPQIHKKNKYLAKDLQNKVELITGDVRDKKIFFDSLDGIDTVIHLAAATGTGQSMYDVPHYESVNILGTTHLIDYLVNHPEKSSINKIVVASSRAVYGEGSYNCPKHGTINPGSRIVDDMQQGNFEPFCPKCNVQLTLISTNESERFSPSSFYGLTKQFQEQLILMYCENIGISGYALRFQNVYGPGQSLNNPYTGILAIFSTLAREDNEISIFEDGNETRDFIYIDDVINATYLCLDPKNKDVDVFNVGSGISTSVKEVADKIISHFSSKSKTNINGAFRKGDIRHNKADISKINSALGFVPKWTFKEGLTKFLNWAELQEKPSLEFEKSLNEMKEAGQYFTKK